MICPKAATGAVTVRVAARAIAADGFRAHGAQLTLRTAKLNRVAISAAVERLETNRQRTFRQLRAHCNTGEWSQTGFSCGPTLLTLQDPGTGTVHLEIRRLQVNGLKEAEALRIVDLRIADVAQQLRGLTGMQGLDVDLRTPTVTLTYGLQTWRVREPLIFNAWGGSLQVSDLRVTWPYPRGIAVSANVTIERIELERLTSAYAFGSIKGRLNGTVRDLYLQNWQPERFDASFETAPDSDSPQTISQRAVENLTQVSGAGPTQALSRGLAGVFSEFSYSKLGLRCKLRGDTCSMDGIATTPTGYVIVQRGLLPPWIDVIGYNRQVNWQDLVQRLQSVTANTGPPVE